MYQFKSKVRYSEVNSDKTLTLASLTNYLQDTCTFQSEGLGVGMDVLRKRQGAWFLSSWEIVIKEMPKACQEISIGTFPYSFKGFCGGRNFCVTDAKDEVIAMANSQWVYINYETKKPDRIPEDIARAYDAVMEEPLAFEWSNRKIRYEGDGEKKEPIMVQRFFIDTNEHMNNGKYIMVAEGYLPKDFKVERMRVEYRKAAVLGDVLCPAVYMEEDYMTVALNDEAGKPYAVIQFVKESNKTE